MVSHAVGARFIVADRRRRCCRSTTGTPTCRSPRRRCSATRPTCPSPATGGTPSYLMMWGSNVPVTRTPDAHWMAEARYRGQKVVVVSPDYADNVKFADEWLPAAARHRRRAGDGDGPRDPEGVLRRPADAATSSTTSRRYTDLPFLVTPRAERRRRRTGRASSSPPPTSARPTPRTRVQDRSSGTARPARRRCRTARSGFRFGEAGRRAAGTSTSAPSTRR